MARKSNKASSGRYPLPVRLLALLMTALVASGAVVYLVLLFMELFGG